MTLESQSAKQPVAEKVRAARQDETQLFRRFIAWPEDLGQDWRRSTREAFAEAPDRKVHRTVWDSPRGATVRILVDVVECASAEDALGALIDRLEWNELASVANGPPDLGVARFAHPDKVPPALFFARANLCCSVVSFAREFADVFPVARRIDDRIAAPTPELSNGRTTLDVVQRPAGPGLVSLTLAAPFPITEDGYERYSAEGGTLSIRDDRVVVAPTAAEAQVSAFIIERGREATGVRVRISGR